TRRPGQPELEAWTSMLDFRDFRASAQSFSDIAAVSPVWSLVMTGRGEAERLEGLFASAGFFPMPGGSPVLGRSFRPEEDRQGNASSVIMLSHSLWQRRFAGSIDVLGSSITLDNRSYSVIGVLPAGFRYAGEPLVGTVSEIDIWLPLSAN